jgi:uncharacterized damage-inducible protein DinB
MKPIDTLTILFSHHLWANLRLLEQCAELSADQLTATISGARGPIQETLEHIVTSEQSYLSRISNGQPYSRTADAAPMTIAEMIAAAQQTGQGFIEWASRVHPTDTVRVMWEGTPRDVPKTIILTQVINHATEHREQVKATLTEMGIEPPDLQGWVYFEEHHDQFGLE